ncbi:MAG: zinc-ribbon domain-containing protein [Clostridiales bacterium]|jgi:hypothetical protein|nr:zinc-ribbon domain-containing protein [Clostridiales bacterium]MDR2751205.1 zinc-ribbon domain-containing protein [Clostridiales bacterium]
MYCPKCGEAISDNARFCKFCGAILVDSVDEGIAAPAAIKRNIRAVNGESSRRFKREKKRGSPWPIFLVVILLLAGAGAFAFYWQQKALKAEQQEQIDRANITALLRQFESSVTSLDAHKAISLCTSDFQSQLAGLEGSDAVLEMLPDSSLMSTPARSIVNLNFSFSMDFGPDGMDIGQESATVKASTFWSVKFIVGVDSRSSSVVFDLQREDGEFKINSISRETP